MRDRSETILHNSIDYSGPGGRLPLMELFYTIQGEGHHQGKAATFVRVGGCDVGCVWCDVKESWDASKYSLIDVKSMLDQIQQNRSKLVVITGGEPMMYNLNPLTKILSENGFTTHLETSGAYELTGEWDWVCVSPKKFKKPEPSAIKKADELKIVVYHPSDIAWGVSFMSEVSKECKLYFQPEWSRSAKLLPQIIDYVKTDPRWEISLQIHKFMNIP